MIHEQKVGDTISPHDEYSLDDKVRGTVQKTTPSTSDPGGCPLTRGGHEVGSIYPLPTKIRSEVGNG